MQEAPKYGISVTEEDIDATLRDIAKGDSESITDAEFNEWYRQRLNYTQLSDEQFRDLVKRSLLQQRLMQYFADNTPSVADQVHLSVIIVKTYDEATSLKERSDNGEEFASLAREASLDTESGQNGGDIGWIPISLLEDRFQYVLVDLAIGKCSEPIINTMQTDTGDTDTTDYALFMISERDVNREVSAEHIESLKAKAYSDWLIEQWNSREIKYYGLRGGGIDPYTQAWLNYQLERLKKGTSSTSSSST
jgi:hypothetical protein